VAALLDWGPPKAGNFAAVHMTAIDPRRRFAAVNNRIAKGSSVVVFGRLERLVTAKGLTDQEAMDARKEA
jgi:hypothetical protein